MSPPKKKPRKDAPYFFVLFLDPSQNVVEINEFRFENLQAAQQKYEESEERARKQSGAQAVLVSLEKVSQLRRAYPNYFLDTRDFLNEVRRTIA